MPQGILPHQPTATVFAEVKALEQLLIHIQLQDWNSNCHQKMIVTGEGRPSKKQSTNLFRHLQIDRGVIRPISSGKNEDVQFARAFHFLSASRLQRTFEKNSKTYKLQQIDS